MKKLILFFGLFLLVAGASCQQQGGNAPGDPATVEVISVENFAQDIAAEGIQVVDVRTQEEVDAWIKRDPIELFRARLVQDYGLASDEELAALENKIDQLIELCNQLNRENQSLKADSARWQREREELINKNAMARDKVEAMLNRLRAME